MIRWMIDEGHLDEDDDPTIGLHSGKAKASRESGGFLPWTEEDMTMYRAKWPLGTEARLMFDILHCTFLHDLVMHILLGHRLRATPDSCDWLSRKFRSDDAFRSCLVVCVIG
jgi:hypothetical protein